MRSASAREDHFRRVPQVLHERAGGADGKRMPVETEAFEAARVQLIQQRPARRLGLEHPPVDRRNRQPRRDNRRRHAVDAALVLRDDDLARTQNRQLVDERLVTVGAGVFRRVELAGGEIDQRDADGVGWCGRSRAAGGDGHDERRLARVEIIRVGQRSRRDHANDFALHDAFRFARVLHLIADGDAESLLHQPRDIGVDGVMRHAAHRDPAAGRVLRPRGQRQLERPRGDQRVFVEHLVKVAHPEQQDGVAMLLFGVEILTHRGRRRR